MSELRIKRQECVFCVLSHTTHIYEHGETHHLMATERPNIYIYIYIYTKVDVNMAILRVCKRGTGGSPHHTETRQIVNSKQNTEQLKI